MRTTHDERGRHDRWGPDTRLATAAEACQHRRRNRSFPIDPAPVKKGRLLTAAGLVLATVLGLSHPTDARDACPGGAGAEWFLTSTDQLLDRDVGNKADLNGDGLVCAQINKGSMQRYGLGGIVWIVKDNNEQGAL
jgi:hypothetical protein